MLASYVTLVDVDGLRRGQVDAMTTEDGVIEIFKWMCHGHGVGFSVGKLAASSTGMPGGRVVVL
jgi:hypothetical protein